MSIKRYRARKDVSQDAIVATLRSMGASVYVTSDKGIPDLLCGYRGVTILAECKSKRGKLTPSQDEFISEWRGSPVYILHDADEATAMLNNLAES